MSTLQAFASDAMSPAEIAYFESGGTVVEGIETVPSGGQLDLSLEKPATPKDPPADSKAPDEDEDVTLDAEGRPHGKDGQFVPHAALHKERQRRKTVEAENMTIREKMARAEERLAVINELIAKGGEGPAVPAAAAPGATEAPTQGKSALDEEPIDMNVDPFGAMDQLRRQNAELLRLHKDGAQKQQEAQRTETISNAYLADARTFMEKTPDFKDAYMHLVAGLHAEYEAMGIADVAQRNAMIGQQEKELVAQLLGSKRSPSEALYAIAKARGYSPKSQSVDPAPQQSKPSLPQAAPSNASAKIDNILKGQQAVVSLASAGGSSGEGLTLEALASMSEEEFSKVASRLGKSKLKQLMGG